MGLKEEISVARQKIVKDGFDMSIGELIRIYEKKELIINPAYQRQFRWDESRKTRFIESLILGIPIPPIFVYTDEQGRWELIDGLQRLSTVLEFAGVLINADGKRAPAFVPSGTKLLPSLNDVAWEADNTDSNPELPVAVRLDLERVRIRVEILKRESDGRAKYELFQRLNTGGASLSPQEARSCVAIMLNPNLFQRMERLSENEDFKACISLTERKQEEQKDIELVLRLLAYRYQTYDQTIDVHDWLDDVLITMSQDKTYDIDSEEKIFERTFALLHAVLGENSFKRYANGSFSGAFSIAAFEVISLGVSKNIDTLQLSQSPGLREKVEQLWNRPEFMQSTKAGTRGSTRLSKLLPLAAGWFAG